MPPPGRRGQRNFEPSPPVLPTPILTRMGNFADHLWGISLIGVTATASVSMGVRFVALFPVPAAGFWSDAEGGCSPV